MVYMGVDLRLDSRNLDCVTILLPKHGAHLGCQVSQHLSRDLSAVNTVAVSCGTLLAFIAVDHILLEACRAITNETAQVRPKGLLYAIICY